MQVLLPLPNRARHGLHRNLAYRHQPKIALTRGVSAICSAEQIPVRFFVEHTLGMHRLKKKVFLGQIGRY